ncbi:MAG: hypothetical protein H6Q65_2874 [Firmicutes bacterium]|nr:hypothetical protein [Bacillota bacterium]
MERVSKIVMPALQSNGMKDKFVIYYTLSHWQEIVGPDISLHTNPGHVQAGTLFVNVDNSVWCHHLTMMKEDILEKINCFAAKSFAVEKIIRNIRFQAGNLKNKQNESYREETEKPIVLTVEQQDRQAAKQLVPSIENKNLQYQLLRLISKDMAFKKYRRLEKWHVCQQCHSFCAPTELYCDSCKRIKKQEKELSIRKLLLEIPWLTFEECSQYVVCTTEEFKKAKNHLIEKFAQIVYTGFQDKIQMATLIMLVKMCKPSDITEEMEQQIIRKYGRRTKSVFTSRS